MVMLASDLNNPAFVGPVNPDSLLAITFYKHKPFDANLTQKAIEEGRSGPVHGPEMDYVQIQAGGDHTSIVDVPVREEHKRRWPDKWLYYQIQNGEASGGADVPGWKIEEWTHLSPEQLRDLKHMRFSVVEQIAGASDAQIQRIGMGGLGLREAAKQALRARMGAETKEALEAKDAQIATLREAQAAQAEQIAELMAMMKQQNTLHANQQAKRG